MTTELELIVTPSTQITQQRPSRAQIALDMLREKRAKILTKYETPSGAVQSAQSVVYETAPDEAAKDDIFIPSFLRNADGDNWGWDLLRQMDKNAKGGE